MNHKNLIKISSFFWFFSFTHLTFGGSKALRLSLLKSRVVDSCEINNSDGSKSNQNDSITYKHMVSLFRNNDNYTRASSNAYPVGSISDGLNLKSDTLNPLRSYTPPNFRYQWDYYSPELKKYIAFDSRIYKMDNNNQLKITKFRSLGDYYNGIYSGSSEQGQTSFDNGRDDNNKPFPKKTLPILIENLYTKNGSRANDTLTGKCSILETSSIAAKKITESEAGLPGDVSSYTGNNPFFKTFYGYFENNTPFSRENFEENIQIQNDKIIENFFQKLEDTNEADFVRNKKKITCLNNQTKQSFFLETSPNSKNRYAEFSKIEFVVKPNSTSNFTSIKSPARAVFPNIETPFLLNIVEKTKIRKIIDFEEFILSVINNEKSFGKIRLDIYPEVYGSTNTGPSFNYNTSRTAFFQKLWGTRDGIGGIFPIPKQSTFNFTPEECKSSSENINL